SWAKFAQALANALRLGTMRARIRRARTCARQAMLRHPAAKRLVGSPAPTASKVCEGEVKPIHLRAPDLHGQAELVLCRFIAASGFDMGDKGRAEANQAGANHLNRDPVPIEHGNRGT